MPKKTTAKLANALIAKRVTGDKTKTQSHERLVLDSEGTTICVSLGRTIPASQSYSFNRADVSITTPCTAKNKDAEFKRSLTWAYKRLDEVLEIM